MMNDEKNKNMSIRRSNLNEYNWESFFEEFQNESPRAAVILAGAFLDSLLCDILASFMVDDGVEVKKLLERPLSSFDARISAAYCLGFISKVEREDLIFIKEIRNKFAHKIHGFTFDNDEIVMLCNKLQIPIRFNEVLPSVLNTHENKFKFTVSFLLMQLSMRIFEAETKRQIIRDETQIGQVIRVD